MYYEEKLIDGILHCRTSPNEVWRKLHGNKADIVNALASMSSGQREEILQYFCMCGGCILSENGICNYKKNTCQFCSITKINGVCMKLGIPISDNDYCSFSE